MSQGLRVVSGGKDGAGSWGQADVASVSRVLTCRWAPGPSREGCGIHVFSTINEEHSYPVGLRGAADGPGPGK